MDTNTKIEFVLGCQMRPSTKVGMVTLILADKPLTVVELNNYLNTHKTFDNYQTLFESEIDSGLIQIQQMKDANGYKRQHFCIDNDILEELISDI